MEESLPQCPSCGHTIQQDFGMVTCEGCQAVLMIDYEGRIQTSQDVDYSEPSYTNSMTEESDFSESDEITEDQTFDAQTAPPSQGLTQTRGAGDDDFPTHRSGGLTQEITSVGPLNEEAFSSFEEDDFPGDSHTDEVQGAFDGGQTTDLQNSFDAEQTNIADGFSTDALDDDDDFADPEMEHFAEEDDADDEFANHSDYEEESHDEGYVSAEQTSAGFEEDLEDEEEWPEEEEQQSTPQTSAFSEESSVSHSVSSNDDSLESFPMASKPDTDPVEISDYANSSESSLDQGELLYDVTITRIDSKELRETIRLTLSDEKLKLNPKDYAEAMKSGQVTIQNLNPIKAKRLVEQLQYQNLDIKWRQKRVIMEAVDLEEDDGFEEIG